MKGWETKWRIRKKERMEWSRKKNDKHWKMKKEDVIHKRDKERVDENGER